VPSFRDTFEVATTAYQLDIRTHLTHDIVGTMKTYKVPIPLGGTPVYYIELLQPGCFSIGGLTVRGPEWILN
jgi:hypothetical protein